MNDSSLTLIRANIPAELKALRQWGLWKCVLRDGRETKVPKTTDCYNASTSDLSTWTTFETACAAYEAGGFDGIGFVFVAGGGFTGVDLDDCIDDTGNLAPRAQQVVQRLNSYTEISPSGRGVHVIMAGQLPPGSTRRRTGRVEMYDSGRYFCMTGQHLEGTPTTVEERTAALAELHRELFAETVGFHSSLTADASAAANDDELIAAIKSNGDSKLLRLWRGETSRYPSQSEADLALCNDLVRICGIDRARIDRLFRRSGLMRPKWDELRGQKTYGDRTIEKALGGADRVSTRRADLPSDSKGSRLGKRCAEAAPSEPEHDSGLVYDVKLTGRTKWTVNAFLGGNHLDTQYANIEDTKEREKVAGRLADRVRSKHDSEVEWELIAEELMGVALRHRERIATLRSPGYHHYRATSDGLIYDKPCGDGTVPTPLTNFLACIVADTTYDDGAEQWRVFKIEVELAGKHCTFEVPAAQFSSMNWPHEHLGARAVVFAGMGTRDHARAAVQLLSSDVELRTIYAQTGWRKIADRWVYLHGGGAIGPNGPVPGIEVSLSGKLQHYQLPDPPVGEELREAVRASLRFLDVAPARVTFPLYAMVWRALLGPSDLSGHVTGKTGERKTELAALAQQHFGPEMHAKNLPGSWSSTENALEGQAFTLAETLFVIDDFVPEGGLVGAARLHSKAARVLRSQGNRSGRDRMRPDSTLRPTKYPRGLILSTGEEIPHGHSLQARVFIVEVEVDDVNLDVLTAAQKDAVTGLYAEAVAGYVRSLAGEYERLRERFATEVADLRGELLGEGRHGRTCEIAAALIVAFRYFAAFAVQAGALNDRAAVDLAARVRDVIVDVAATQVEHHRGEDPVRVFADLLRSALSSGRAYLRSIQGDAPPDAGRWGWERRVAGRDRETGELHEYWLHAPGADCIGIVDDVDLFLQPEAAHRVAKDADRDGRFLIGVKTLGKRLKESAELVSHEGGRSTKRLTIGDGRRRRYHLRTSYLFPSSAPVQPGQSDQTPPSALNTHHLKEARQ